MPSLPLFNGVAIPYCAGIHADGRTIKAINTLTGVDGKSLPSIKSLREHKIFSSHLYINEGGKFSDGCTSDAIGPSGSIQPLGKGVDGTLACPTNGVKAIIFSPYHHKNGGGGYMLTAVPPMLSARAGPSDRLAHGLMAPMPISTGAAMPSLSRYSFYRPAQSAAVSAAKLEVVEGTSLKIAVAILGGRWVTDGWAMAHLA
jgi:hypothetical protein